MFFIRGWAETLDLEINLLWFELAMKNDESENLILKQIRIIKESISRSKVTTQSRMKNTH